MTSPFRQLLCGAALLGWLMPAWAQPLRIGMEMHAPLFVQDSNGFAQGLYVDWIDKIARAQSWDVQFIGDDLEDLLVRLENNQLDAIIGVPANQPVAPSLVLGNTELLVRWSQIFVPARPKWEDLLGKPPAVRNFLDLQDKSVAVRQGREAENLARECARFAITCRIEEKKSSAEVFQALADHLVEAAAVDSLTAQLEAAAHPVEATDVLFAPESLRIAVSAARVETVLAGIEPYLESWRGGVDPFYRASLDSWLKGPQQAVRRADHFAGYVLAVPSAVLILVLLGIAVVLARRHGRQRGHSYELDMLRRNEQRYRTLVENLPYGLQETDLDGKILFSNTLEHQIRRYHHGELLGRSIFDMLAFDKEKKELRAYWQRIISEQPKPAPYHVTILRKDGELADIRAEWNYKRDEQGRVCGFYALLSDVTESEHIKQKIISRQRDLHQVVQQRAEDLKEAYTDLLMAATVFEHTDQGILVMDPTGAIESANPAFLKISGYREDEINGKPLADFVSKRHDRKYHDHIIAHLQKSGAWQGEMLQERKNGKLYPAWASINAVLDSHEQVKQYVVLLTDISRLKKAEQQIWRQAHFDNLTGLPNRNLFYQRLSQSLDKAEAGKHKLALMFIDLDRFKEVNDTLGHDAGDDLLRQVSVRLKECVAKEATVARMGGDEFTVILPKLDTPDSAEESARKILKELARTFELTLKSVNISGSVGIVLYPDQGLDMTALLKNADIAMYQAKDSGRDTYRLFKAGD